MRLTNKIPWSWLLFIAVGFIALHYYREGVESQYRFEEKSVTYESEISVLKAKNLTNEEKVRQLETLIASMEKSVDSIYAVMNIKEKKFRHEKKAYATVTTDSLYQLWTELARESND